MKKGDVVYCINRPHLVGEVDSVRNDITIPLVRLMWYEKDNFGKLDGIYRWFCRRSLKIYKGS